MRLLFSHWFHSNLSPNSDEEPQPPRQRQVDDFELPDPGIAFQLIYGANNEADDEDEDDIDIIERALPACPFVDDMAEESGDDGDDEGLSDIESGSGVSDSDASESALSDIASDDSDIFIPKKRVRQTIDSEWSHFHSRWLEDTVWYFLYILYTYLNFILIA